jgi:hypothetical protein
MQAACCCKMQLHERDTRGFYGRIRSDSQYASTLSFHICALSRVAMRFLLLVCQSVRFYSHVICPVR